MSSLVRLAVSVQPRLLHDALLVMLARPGREVVDLQPVPDCHIDVAVISGPPPAALCADAVLMLPALATCSGWGTLRTQRAERAVPIRDVDAVLAVVDRLCRLASAGSGRITSSRAAGNITCSNRYHT